MQKRIAEKLTALDDQIPDGPFECSPPEPAWRDMLVATVKQHVVVSKQPSLFNRTKVYELHRSAVEEFLRAFYVLWSTTVKAELLGNFIQPIKNNFEEVHTAIDPP
ncbi:hypothetical protein Pmar_PMAR027122 [Perkinsus marinus ATCC 50983]|uniref:Uncharacterized protein n=1 Tax=Perkinsus marinus (strain ATCC 50983 / TXsc) TaxID=423536 RepID=C5LXW7_PERM5|nr:hypothetical protein Pmar_PMAR027122 [Perkinsus marinus ATCC 50983]EEQ98425.1 hypothetical protein Pmar_PMAR027122 [Perkinsus marinus ATCC 50983]|eukprot:XP_002765708.1 hypothetical protein Pmar_PMAR027122 [Perkinsus marinus ATCC 50983]